MSYRQREHKHFIEEFERGKREIEIGSYIVTIYRPDDVPDWKRKKLEIAENVNRFCKGEIVPTFVATQFSRSHFIFTITTTEKPREVLGFAMTKQRVTKHSYVDDKLWAQSHYFLIEVFCCNGKLSTASTPATRVGASLMEAVTRFAKEHQYCHVELMAIDSAIGFYKKVGFLMGRNACERQDDENDEDEKEDDEEEMFWMSKCVCDSKEKSRANIKYHIRAIDDMFKDEPDYDVGLHLLEMWKDIREIDDGEPFHLLSEKAMLDDIKTHYAAQIPTSPSNIAVKVPKFLSSIPEGPKESLFLMRLFGNKKLTPQQIKNTLVDLAFEPNAIWLSNKELLQAAVTELEKVSGHAIEFELPFELPHTIVGIDNLLHHLGANSDDPVMFRHLLLLDWKKVMGRPKVSAAELRLHSDYDLFHDIIQHFERKWHVKITAYRQFMGKILNQEAEVNRSLALEKILASPNPDQVREKLMGLIESTHPKMNVEGMSIKALVEQRIRDIAHERKVKVADVEVKVPTWIEHNTKAPVHNPVAIPILEHTLFMHHPTEEQVLKARQNIYMALQSIAFTTVHRDSMSTKRAVQELIAYWAKQPPPGQWSATGRSQRRLTLIKDYVVPAYLEQHVPTVYEKYVSMLEPKDPKTRMQIRSEFKNAIGKAKQEYHANNYRYSTDQNNIRRGMAESLRIGMDDIAEYEIPAWLLAL